MNDQNDQREELARRKRVTQLSVIAFFVAAAVIGGLIAISQSGGDDNDFSSSSGGGVAEIAGIPQSNTVLGETSAPVTITEFGDLQCPICRQFGNTVFPELVSQYVKPGTAKYDFKQWVIIGPQSNNAAAAAYAAGDAERGPAAELGHGDVGRDADPEQRD